MKFSSTGSNWRWPLITSIAPVLFGSIYWVTHNFLPAGSPLWGSVLRALPAGFALLLIARQLPRGIWWWRSAVLGSLNMGLFFLLIYIAAQLLPSSIAASIASISPLVIAGVAWLLTGERPTARFLVAAVLGVVGVLLIVGTAEGVISPVGVAASLGAMLLMSVGAVLTKRWDDGTPLLASTAWQLIAGGLELIVVAVWVEGAPPAIDATGLFAFAYISLIATALGFVCWFYGFRHLPAATVGMIGLLNPVTGVLLGVGLASETLTVTQIVGVLLVLSGIAFAQLRKTAAPSRTDLATPAKKDRPRSSCACGCPTLDAR